jgi:hypothetical protein
MIKQSRRILNKNQIINPKREIIVCTWLKMKKNKTKIIKNQ